MFYETTEIRDLLKCQKCLQPYDEYFSPRILPCCGKTICHKCVQSIEKEIKDNRFKCGLCTKSVAMPDNGLLVNEVANQLIAKQPKEVYRGEETQKLIENLIDTETNLEKLTFELNNGDHLIKEECRELKRRVQLSKEKRIEEISVHTETLLQIIDNYERECIYNYCKLRKDKANILINQTNSTVKRQRDYLKKLQIDDRVTVSLNEKLNELKSLIEKERKSIQIATFSDEPLKFETNRSTIDKELLVVLNTATITK